MQLVCLLRVLHSEVSLWVANLGADAREAPAGNAKFLNALTMVLEHADIDEQLRGGSLSGGSSKSEGQQKGGASCLPPEFVEQVQVVLGK